MTMQECINFTILLQRLRELGDHQWNDYLHTTLADFLMDYIGCDSTYDILETVGIVRANRSASNVRFVRILLVILTLMFSSHMQQPKRFTI